ncbi:hypothetical protein [Pyrinomonas methylaliphatogenes]|uniref:Uncharacterized protein n=1 Tax=Pyrinomonas methylaliphatogenes TaxID=454194 RepID=A0A0B6X1Y9_9BACT|nr:hypothetical protein [Pyrinomonas methylaliphatogenes]MBX5478099.1 hypothetical protein [Pyrinomonas methylaliphatogenes]CDM66390.1 hypothetical protein PYK22_02419 [Pyrinomonas methylaliphatogenes]
MIDRQKFPLFAISLLFAALFAAPAPSAAQAGPPPWIREKKSEKFINGHDARDGRWDGRGPQRGYWRDDDRWDRRGWDRDRDRVRDKREIRNYAQSIGYREGYRLGREDRFRGRKFNYRDNNIYRDALLGYRDSFDDRDLYRRSFREGFKRGYEDGYRDARRGPFGGIFGH